MKDNISFKNDKYTTMKWIKSTGTHTEKRITPKRVNIHENFQLLLEALQFFFLIKEICNGTSSINLELPNDLLTNHNTTALRTTLLSVQEVKIPYFQRVRESFILPFYLRLTCKIPFTILY